MSSLTSRFNDTVTKLLVTLVYRRFCRFIWNHRERCFARLRGKSMLATYVPCSTLYLTRGQLAKRHARMINTSYIIKHSTLPGTAIFQLQKSEEFPLAPSCMITVTSWFSFSMDFSTLQVLFAPLSIAY